MVHAEQMEFAGIYARQIDRWRTEGPAEDQARKLDRMAAQNRHLRAVTADVLALARELRQGTIDRVMATGDMELGLWASSAGGRTAAADRLGQRRFACGKRGLRPSCDGAGNRSLVRPRARAHIGTAS